MKTGKKGKMKQKNNKKDEIAQRYFAALALIVEMSDEDEGCETPEEAHELVSALLQELDRQNKHIEVNLDDMYMLETKH